MSQSILENYFSEDEVAEFLGVKIKSLRTYRSGRKGMGKEFLKIHPPYIKYGRKIFFQKEQFQEWFENRQDNFEDSEANFQLDALARFKENQKIR